MRWSQGSGCCGQGLPSDDNLYHQSRGKGLEVAGGCSACIYVHNMPALKLSDADAPGRQEKNPAKTELNWTAERNIPAYTQNFNTGATVVRPHRVLM